MKRSIILNNEKAGVHFLKNLTTINNKLKFAFEFKDIDEDNTEVFFYANEDDCKYLDIVLTAFNTDNNITSLKDLICDIYTNKYQFLKEDITMAIFISIYIYIIYTIKKEKDNVSRLNIWDDLISICDEFDRKDIKNVIVDSYYGQCYYNDGNNEHNLMAKNLSSALYFFWNYSNLTSDNNNGNNEINAREFNSGYETIMKTIFWIMCY